MRLEFYEKEKLKQELTEIVGQYLDLKKYKVFFFGSRVGGKSNSRSDVDIGIEGPKPLPIEILGRIKEKISNLPTLYSIDVVDFKRTAPDFQKVAKKHIESINL